MKIDGYKSCKDTTPIKKTSAATHIMNYNIKSLGKKFRFISKYDEGIGIWPLLKLKKIIDITDLKPSTSELERLFTEHELLIAQHHFKHEKKRILYILFKYALFSDNFDNLRKTYLKSWKNIADEQEFLLTDDGAAVRTKLACFAMIDLDEITIKDIINSDYFKFCIRRKF